AASRIEDDSFESDSPTLQFDGGGARLAGRPQVRLDRSQGVGRLSETLVLGWADGRKLHAPRPPGFDSLKHSPGRPVGHRQVDRGAHQTDTSLGHAGSNLDGGRRRPIAVEECYPASNLR